MYSLYIIMKATTILCLLVLAGLSLCTSAKTIRTAHGEWELVWEEQFKGKKLSPYWSRIERNKADWGNYMSKDDRLFSQKGGILTLWGRVNDFLPSDTARYLTGGITTSHRKLFSRGRIEIRIKMDNATGAWPAAWLLPQYDAWPNGGEIDIMERLNGNEIAYQTVHSPFTLYDKTVKNKPRSGFTGPIKKDDYNVYGVELYADSLCFFINDQYTGTYRRMPEYGEQQYPFDRPMYLLIDMQLGGKWVGGVNPKDLPYRYQIDYVKFYKKK